VKRRCAVAALSILAVCTVTGAESQDSPQAGAVTFQTGAKLVMVPVVVRDREGHTVTDLGKDSFQVFDKGKPQPIEAFSVERSDAGQLATATMVAATHFIAYFFDDVSLHDFGTVAPLREAALHNIAGLQPSDRAAIFSSSCRLVMDFTDDRAKLQEVVSKLEPNPIRVCRVAQSLPLQITLLQALVSRMAHLPGAKRIVIVSAGFPVNRDEQKIRESLIDEAVQAKVSIDSLHIAENRSGMGSLPPLDPSWRGYANGISSGSAADVYSENLHVVADGTGGTVVEAENTPEAGLRQLATPDCIYLLSFVPAGTADGSYHKLKVTVKDPRKLTVRARAGYYANQTAAAHASAEALPTSEPAVVAQPAANAPPPAAQPQPGEITAQEEKLTLQPRSGQPQAGEITTREETPTFQSRVNLVRVPVVIRDKQGHTVGSFGKEGFQLTDRGKPQSIAQFALEGSAVAVGDGHARPAAAEAQPTAPAPAAAAPKPVVPSRFVAFVFDDAHLTLGDLMNARIAALKHIEKGIPPQERVALLTLSGNVTLEFTDDLAKFRQALMKVMPIPPRVHFPPATFYMADQWLNRDDQTVLQVQTNITNDCLQHPPNPQRIAEDTLREVANEGRGDATNAFRILNNAVRLLGSMPGDRIMILTSPGIYLPDDLQRELGESIDHATRSGVIINTLDARGVYSVDPVGDVPNCRLTLPWTGQQVGKYNHDAMSSQGMVLSTLADSTGGTALAQNDFAAEFDRLATPPEYVYYLGFYPKDLKPDGRYHEIKVTLANSKGLSIEARKGYWAPAHEEDAAAAATREIGEAVFSRDEVHDLPADMRTAVSRGQATAELAVVANVDLKLLHYGKADGRNSDDVTVVAAVFDRNGNYLEGKQQLLKLRLRDETLAGLEQRPPEMLKSTFNLSPGTYLVRLVVRSAEGGAMTTTSGSVEIP